jgi:ribosomal protein S18 acetylase RimI-like enzyme
MTTSTLTSAATIAGDYAWRSATHADLPALHALLLAAAAAEDNPAVSSLEDLTREFDDPWSDPAVDSRVAIAPDGSAAAYARIFANPQPEEEARAYLDDAVHPDHVEQLHDAVLDWLVAQGTQRLNAITAAQPGGFAGPRTLRLGTPDTETQRMARYERHGFRPIRFFFRMRRDLSQPIPDRPLPEGLTLTTYRPAIDAAVHAAHEEAFADHWGHETITPEDWQQFVIQHSHFRPGLTPVVLEGDHVVAFSMNRVNPEENARQGYTTGWIGSLGTRRAWRHKGLASALLVWSMRAFQAEGLQFATLGVDAENPTGALGLYEKLGFVSYRRFIAYGRPIERANGDKS